MGGKGEYEKNEGFNTETAGEGEFIGFVLVRSELAG